MSTNEMKIERLEDALLEFVERVAHQPTSENEIEVLPQVADVLARILGV